MERSREELEKSFDALPPGLQDACLWALKHPKLVKGLCQDCGMTAAELAKERDEALAQQDYLLFLLFCIAQEMQRAREQGEAPPWEKDL